MFSKILDFIKTKTQKLYFVIRFALPLRPLGLRERLCHLTFFLTLKIEFLSGWIFVKLLDEEMLNNFFFAKISALSVRKKFLWVDSHYKGHNFFFKRTN